VQERPGDNVTHAVTAALELMAITCNAGPGADFTHASELWDSVRWWVGLWLHMHEAVSAHSSWVRGKPAAASCCQAHPPQADPHATMHLGERPLPSHLSPRL